MKTSAMLAPYACRPEESRGRLHAEPESPSRTVFQRDRDRILHSTAFRRLQYKTQVFVYHEGDHYRTRLTHSLEVAQIARTISRALGLNEDLAEALALGHDLGHTPFGHAGEDALGAVMQPFGGFDHNDQTLRILTRLERHYAAFDGLNLAWETLEGTVKHNGPLIGRAQAKPLPNTIAEYVARHDLDDGLRAGLFAVKDLAEVPLVGPVFGEVAARHPGLDEPRLIHESIRRLSTAWHPTSSPRPGGGWPMPASRARPISARWARRWWAVPRRCEPTTRRCRRFSSI